jgi:hypothetical protein
MSETSNLTASTIHVQPTGPSKPPYDWRREPLRCTCDAGLGGVHSKDCMMYRAQNKEAQ